MHKTLKRNFLHSFYSASKSQDFFSSLNTFTNKKGKSCIKIPSWIIETFLIIRVKIYKTSLFHSFLPSKSPSGIYYSTSLLASTAVITISLTLLSRTSHFFVAIFIKSRSEKCKWNCLTKWHNQTLCTHSLFFFSSPFFLHGI